MQHPNKNSLLEYFYREGNDLELNRTRKHLRDCVACREYLQTLEETTSVLNGLLEENPPQDTFDSILKEVDISSRRNSRKRQLMSVIPYFQIALAIPFILAVLYFFQNRLRLLPLWENLEKIWLIDAVGSFGLVAIIFFLTGSFITMAIAPVLLLKAGKLENHMNSIELSWR